MTTTRLEAPASSDELYLARGADVPLLRPIGTGDIFTDVHVPGFHGAAPQAEANSSVMVMTHPCSMRSDGVELVPRLLVAPVRSATHEIPLSAWKGSYRVMPLPSLFGDEQFVVHLDELERVDSSLLTTERRVAVLDPRGVNLLLQRLVHHLSRVVVPTADFDAACSGAMAELEIVEDWLTEARDAGESSEVAALRCHDWLREQGPDGIRRQDHLHDPQRRSAIRRDARAAQRSMLDE